MQEAILKAKTNGGEFYQIVCRRRPSNKAMRIGQTLAIPMSVRIRPEQPFENYLGGILKCHYTKVIFRQ